MDARSFYCCLLFGKHQCDDIQSSGIHDWFRVVPFRVSYLSRASKNYSIIMDLSYILNELGEERGQYYNAVAPPIIQTSNFAFRKVADMTAAFEDEMSGYLYSRGI